MVAWRRGWFPSWVFLNVESLPCLNYMRFIWCCLFKPRYGEELPIIRRFWRVVFGRRIDITPKLVLPNLRGIREAIASGFGFSVLPDYLCENAVAKNRLTLILKPTKAVTNQIWLAFRKSERQSHAVKLLLDLFDSTQV